MKKIHKRKRMQGHIVIDQLAQQSRFAPVSNVVKLILVLGLIVTTMLVTNPFFGLVMAVVMGVITVVIGGIPLRKYLRVMLVPAGLILISCLAIAFEFSIEKIGILAVPFPSGYLLMTKETALKALFVCAKSVGSVSCLYAYSLSTPMSKIIHGLRQLKVPEVMISLMYLMYRYIFVLLETYQGMKVAAESRMGYAHYWKSIRTTGLVYRNLLVKSYEHAMHNFDAMESRCFDGQVKFLSKEKAKRKSKNGRCKCEFK